MAIELTPPSTMVLAGSDVSFTATGRYSDGTTQDFTSSATWDSSEPTFATVAAGVAHGVAAGDANITATQDGFTGTARLLVTGSALDHVEVAPATASVPAGLSQPFTATAFFTDFTSLEITGRAWWTSSDLAAATVSSGGVATGTGVGAATITATWGGMSAGGVLTVTAAFLQSITVSPDPTTVAKGLTRTFTATGHYSDGSTQDLTGTATWSSSDPAVAGVTAGGIATGAQVGNVTITASYDGFDGTASLEVLPPILQSIAVTPDPATVAKGLTIAFTATGTYSDASTQDLTATATWSSSSANATVSATGVATGAAVGPATITASSGGRSGSASLTVTAPLLQSIAVTPNPATVAMGLTVQLTATGHYSDGSTQDLTSSATWSSSSANASVSSAGVATGLLVGPATITATSGAASGDTSLSVTAPVLQAIDVTPATASIAKGLLQPFSATGHYSDGSTLDLTGAVTWASDSSAATVSATGVANGVAVGVATITATSGAVYGAALLTVTPPELRTVSVTPPTASVSNGYSAKFTATALYTDGSKADVSGSAAWSVSPIVATFDATGLATATAEGTGTVTAAFGGKAGTATLTVTAAVLSSLAVTPADLSLPLGVTQQMTAWGVFSDGTKLDLTAQVAWSSGATGVATISAGGLVTPVSGGATVITATHGLVSAQTTLTVVAAVLVADVDGPLVVTPADPTLSAGTGQPFTATAYYTDGTTADVTALATWSSSDPSVAVSNAAGSKGLVTALTAGTADVTATFTADRTVSDTSTVTVTAAPLVAITIAPDGATVPVAATQQLTATGHFADGSTQDLTTAVAWVAVDPAIASVSNALGEEGLATGLATGTVVIEATYQSVTGSATLIVSGGVLQSIEVLPVDPLLPNKYKLQFTAIGHYSDGTLRNLTTLATWSSSAPTVATISNAAGTQGLATAVAVGTTEITARYGAAPPATVTLDVVTATLRSVTITPPAFSVAVRGTYQLAATGYFTSAAGDIYLDVTRQVTWSSGNKKLATVSKTGLVTGVKAGTVKIYASKRPAAKVSADCTVTAAP
jgi:uncharacterized protein YjdB